MTKGSLQEFAISTVTNKARKLPNRMILHGMPGWGKTSFAAQIPNAIFLMVGNETGLWTLMESGQLPDSIPHFHKPAKTKGDIEAALLELAVQDHPYKVVAIDSGTEVETIFSKEVCERKYSGDWGKFNMFDAGAKETATEWESIKAKIDHLRERGIGTIIITHSQVTNFKNPEGPDYERWQSLSKYAWNGMQNVTGLYNWADIVLFANFQTFVDKKNPNKSDAETKGKASGGEDRVILTQRSAAYDAKNRHGLPTEIECGKSAREAWANFRSAMVKANNNGEKK